LGAEFPYFELTSFLELGDTRMMTDDRAYEKGLATKSGYWGCSIAPGRMGPSVSQSAAWITKTCLLGLWKTGLHCLGGLETCTCPTGFSMTNATAAARFLIIGCAD